MDLYFARYIDRWVGAVLCLGLYGLERLLARFTGRHLPPLRAPTPPAADHPLARPRHLLGIKFYGLGNLVMILPALHALRAGFPEVEIDFLTFPGNMALLEQSGLVRRVLTVDVGSTARF